jgi:predicted ATPase with chaperone activity
MAEPMSSSQLLSPREPGSLEDTGLAESVVERLILNILYSQGDLYGQDLSSAIGLRFSVIQQVVEYLKLRHHVQIKSSMGMGGVGAQYALTESGRVRAHEALEVNQYSGPAPVPLAQYIEQVRRQRPQPGWLTTGALSHALSGMVITQQVLSQVGPAVSSGNSMLVYGKPGDGKTFLIESLNNIEARPVFVPYAIECQGNIVQVYDPIYHQAIEEEQPSVLTISREVSHDRRWVKCKRPFIVSGGELSLDMLDLRYNQISKVYERPFS